MLDDLLTSSRGPGVIGIVIALIVLLGFGGLFLMVTDGSGSYGGENVHTQIKSKERAIRGKHVEILHWQEVAVEYDQRRKQMLELEGVSKSIGLKRDEISNLKEEIEAEKAKIVGLVDQFEDYKKQYRIAEWERAVGEKLKTLTTKDGDVFEQVSIRKVAALGVEIRHENGFKRIPYENLPDEMQDRFQFTVEGAKALAAAEQAMIVRSNKGKVDYLKSVDERRKKEILRNHRSNVAKWQAEIARNEAKIHSNTIAISAAESRARDYRSRGNRGLNYDTAKKAERKADSLRRSTARAHSTISSLRRKISQPAPL